MWIERSSGTRGKVPLHSIHRRSRLEYAASVFSPHYFTARARFRAAVAAAGGRLEVLPLSARGPGGQDLSIDIGWLGAERPRRVLLHSSGLHGVEGFAGSAVQLQSLASRPAIPPETAVVIAHILNP